MKKINIDDIKRIAGEGKKVIKEKAGEGKKKVEEGLDFVKLKIKNRQPLTKKAKIAIAGVVTVAGLGVVGGVALHNNNTDNIAVQPSTKIESQNKEISNTKVATAKFKDLSEIKDNEDKEITLDLQNIKSSDISISTFDEKVAKAEFKGNKWVIEGISSGDTTLTIKDKNNKVLDTVTLKISKSDETIAKEKAEQERIAQEQERIAQEKAEQERIAQEQAEQQRIAQEKAEQERVAQEQAEQQRIAQEQAEQQAQQTSIPKNQTVENVPSNSEMVWITETGSKYHCKNTCGSTNPNNASQVTRAKAESMGLEPCKKCY